MATAITTAERVRLLIEDVLSVEVADGDTDLIETGLLDSLGLVTIIAEIEEAFDIELPLDDLDVNRFRSVNRIAELLG